MKLEHLIVPTGAQPEDPDRHHGGDGHDSGHRCADDEHVDDHQGDGGGQRLARGERFGQCRREQWPADLTGLAEGQFSLTPARRPDVQPPQRTKPRAISRENVAGAQHHEGFARPAAYLPGVVAQSHRDGTDRRLAAETPQRPRRRRAHSHRRIVKAGHERIDQTLVAEQRCGMSSGRSYARVTIGKRRP
jgi:hypothetical protein